MSSMMHLGFLFTLFEIGPGKNIIPHGQPFILPHDFPISFASMHAVIFFKLSNPVMITTGHF